MNMFRELVAKKIKKENSEAYVYLRKILADPVLKRAYKDADIASASHDMIAEERNSVFDQLFKDYFDQPEEVRFVRLYNFHWMDNHSFLKDIIEKDSSMFIKYEAIRSLRIYGSDDSSLVPYFIKLLKDKDAGIRHYSALALGKYQNKEEVIRLGTSALSAALEDKDKFVVFRAIWSLNELPLENIELKNKLIGLAKVEKNPIIRMHELNVVENISKRLNYFKGYEYVGICYYPEIENNYPIIEEQNENKVNLFKIKTLLEKSPSQSIENNKEEIPKILKALRYMAKTEGRSRTSKLIKQFKLWRVISNWEDLGEVVNKYKMLTISEEIFDAIIQNCSAEFWEINQFRSDIKLNGIIKRIVKGGVKKPENIEDLGVFTNYLFSALKDSDSFIRYRTSGILYRIIKIYTTSAAYDLLLAENCLEDIYKIKKVLEEAYQREEESSVKRKIKESLDFSVCFLKGLINVYTVDNYCDPAHDYDV